MNNKKQYKSYSKIMKSLHNQKIAQKESLNNQKIVKKENSILDTYIQMIFDEAIITHQLRKLEEGINAALDSKDKLLFFQLSTQYIKLKTLLMR